MLTPTPVLCPPTPNPQPLTMADLNMACAPALEGRKDEAFPYLRESLAALIPLPSTVCSRTTI